MLNLTDQQMPSMEVLTDLMPEGRRPYAKVREAIYLGYMATSRAGSELASRDAIASVHLNRDTLTPPLTDLVADIVEQTYEALQTAIPFPAEKVQVLLGSLFEHGYRSDY